MTGNLFYLHITLTCLHTLLTSFTCFLCVLSLWSELYTCMCLPFWHPPLHVWGGLWQHLALSEALWSCSAACHHLQTQLLYTQTVEEKFQIILKANFDNYPVSATPGMETDLKNKQKKPLKCRGDLGACPIPPSPAENVPLKRSKSMHSEAILRSLLWK